jgi:hypothetical protein
MRLRTVLAIAIVAVTAAYVCADLARDTSTYGVHDWDTIESYRWLVVDSLVHFHQLPFWDPFSCGGHPGWAAPEGGTSLVSPALPAYLLLPFTVALRAEIVLFLAIALVGTWLLAARFCKDPLVVAAVCVVTVMNSRWALQAGAGHTWHLTYAFLPWAIWCFFRANDASDANDERARLRWIAATAAFFALLIYTGGVYPFPHTALAVSMCGALVAWRAESWQPIVNAIVAMVVGVALAAPKLVPLIDVMSKFPRTVGSREYLDPISFVRTFTSTDSDRASWPFWHTDWAWHEYGIYIGSFALVAIAIGAWRSPKDATLRAVRLTGFAFLLLSLGMIGPWFLLHLVPPFRSQHVPSRFEYPGLLFITLAAAAFGEAKLAELRARSVRPRLVDAAAFALVCLIAIPIAMQARSALAKGFGVVLPPVPRRDRYEQTYAVPPELEYGSANGPASITLHQANVGVIRCSTFHAFNHGEWKLYGGRPPGLGAIGIGEESYRGEAFLDSGDGGAEIVTWSPNEVVVRVHGARVGDLAVLNQNWDESWRANGAPTIALRSMNAYRVTASDETVVFRYRPRAFDAALVISALALAGLVIAGARASARAKKRGASLETPS